MRRFKPIISRFPSPNPNPIITTRYSSPFSSSSSSSSSSPTPLPSKREQRRRTRQIATLLQSPPVPNPPISYYKIVHGHILVSGFQSDTFLGNVLLDCYSKLGCVEGAQKVFDEMPERNLVSWGTVTAMYVKWGLCEEALVLFLESRRGMDEGLNEFVLGSAVRGCSGLGRDSVGGQVHGFLVRIGFNQGVYVGTLLVEMYVKMGQIDEARLVFDELMVKTPVTWTIMIMGYVRNGRSDVALMLFSEMSDDGVVRDTYLISCALSACATLQCLVGGEQIHAYALRRGFERDASVLDVLIDFYTKCGKVRSARKLFDRTVTKNMVTWTTMISGYMKNSCHTDAIELFGEMNLLGWKYDAFACTSVLTSCGSVQALELGRQVHAYTIKANLESDEFVKTGLIDMYCKCDALVDARRVFNDMSDHDVISHNAMIEGYSRNEHLYDALGLYHEMRHKMLNPSLLTFVSLLGLSASILALELSKQIHCLTIKFGISLDTFAGSSLVDVYSKCSLLKDARLVFEEVNLKDVVVWNAMLFGYAQQPENGELNELYYRMQLSGLKPNEFTCVALVISASNLASLRLGQKFHGQLIKKGFDSDPYVTNAVVNMYSKCGSLKEARNMFDSTTWLDVTCFNSMISSYAHHGQVGEALQLYDKMLKERIQPNYVTFIAVLSACSHTGLVETGLDHFHSMSNFVIQPGTEHYASVVALLGRAGKLSEAKAFIEKMPIRPEAIVWRSLLTACRAAGSEQLGAYAARMAISADRDDSGSYILLSNIYAVKGMWREVKEVRNTMDSNQVIKEAGRSWIEVDRKVHVFVAKDKAQGESNAVYSTLDDLVRHMEVHYSPEIT